MRLSRKSISSPRALSGKRKNSVATEEDPRKSKEKISRWRQLRPENENETLDLETQVHTMKMNNTRQDARIKFSLKSNTQL
jgi:hypothetical protein